MILRLGSKGGAVHSVQEMLAFLGFHERSQGQGGPAIRPLVPDGVFDTATEAVLIDFQRSEGLLHDGVVGPSTMRALEEAYTQRTLELHSPGVDLTLGQPDGHFFERVPADRFPPGDEHAGGYEHIALRNDVAEAYRRVYETVHAHGGLLTSSGGIRSLHARVTRSRSATSFHYLGRALDLFLYSGMLDPQSDAYVVSRERERHYRIYARCTRDGNLEVNLAARRTVKRVITYRQRTRGSQVTGHLLDLTEVLEAHGFRPIPARRSFEEGGSTMGAEWWHFQYERGLVEGLSTFGQELLGVYSRDTLQGTPPWSQRDRVFGLNWF